MELQLDALSFLRASFFGLPYPHGCSDRHNSERATGDDGERKIEEGDDVMMWIELNGSTRTAYRPVRQHGNHAARSEGKER